jgi:hypothetical protein
MMAYRILLAELLHELKIQLLIIDGPDDASIVRRYGHAYNRPLHTPQTRHNSQTPNRPPGNRKA